LPDGARYPHNADSKPKATPRIYQKIISEANSNIKPKVATIFGVIYPDVHFLYTQIRHGTYLVKFSSWLHFRMFCNSMGKRDVIFSIITQNNNPYIN
jgi:hypothetical protein